MARTTSTGNYLSFTTSAPVTAPPLTIAGWVYRTGAGTNQGLFTVAAAGGSHRYLLFSSTGNALAANAQGAAGAQSMAGTIPADQWSHVGGVFASTASRIAYLNGAPATENTTDITNTGINALYAGTNSANNMPFSGRIAEFGVWNVALTADEMAALARGASPNLVRPFSLVFYAPIWGKDSPEPDLRGGLRNLALIGTPPLADHAPVALRPRPYFAEQIVSGPVYTQTKFRVYQDDGVSL